MDEELVKPIWFPGELVVPAHVLREMFELGIPLDIPETPETPETEDDYNF